MTNYTLLNTANIGGPISPVSVPNNPTRASYTFSITGPANNYAQATILGSVDGSNFLPFFTMNIAPYGPNIITMENRESDAYVMYGALLNNITPGGYAATVTMTV